MKTVVSAWFQYGIQENSYILLNVANGEGPPPKCSENSCWEKFENLLETYLSHISNVCTKLTFFQCVLLLKTDSTIALRILWEIFMCYI